MPVSRRAFLSAAAAFAAAPVIARAQIVGDPAGDPQSDRRLADLVVAAVNSGAPADLAAVRAVMSPAGAARMPEADMRALLTQLKAYSGGLDLLDVPRERNIVMATVRTRRQRAERILEVRRDRDDLLKLYDVRAMPRPTVYTGSMPTGPVSRRDLRDALEARLAFAARRGDFSGVLRVDAPDGTTVFEAVTGAADAAGREPITPDHRFHLGSADKSFTALMIGGLVHAGRLSFDTRLVDVLPDYPNPEAARQITIRHLLTHGAGLGGLFERPGWNRDRPYARVADLLPIFAAEPLAFEPGSRAEYSNEGYVVLGAVLERLENQDWWSQLFRKIYEPAGMRRSGHFLGTNRVRLRATPLAFAEDDLLGVGRRAPMPPHYRGNSCGGGYSTVADMLAYYRALRSGRLLDGELTDRMSRPAEGGRRDYGMGFTSKTLSGRSVRGHGGGGPNSGVNIDAAVVWETGWAYAILGNYDAPFAQQIGGEVAAVLAAQDA